MKDPADLTPEEIRAGQMAYVELIEEALARGDDQIQVGDQFIHREAAWAATQALRKAFDPVAGGNYDGQERDENGIWWARIEERGATRRVYVGRFPG